MKSKALTISFIISTNIANMKTIITKVKPTFLNLCISKDFGITFFFEDQGQKLLQKSLKYIIVLILISFNKGVAQKNPVLISNLTQGQHLTFPKIPSGGGTYLKLKTGNNSLSINSVILTTSFTPISTPAFVLNINISNEAGEVIGQFKNPYQLPPGLVNDTLYAVSPFTLKANTAYKLIISVGSSTTMSLATSTLQPAPVNIISCNTISVGGQTGYPLIGFTGHIIPLPIQKRLDMGEQPFSIYKTNPKLLDSLYGKRYEGGIIFYLDTLTGNGQVCASTDQTGFAPTVVNNPAMGTITTNGLGVVWGCNGTPIPSAAGSGINDGAANTKAIISGCALPPLTAAYLCDTLRLNGYTDWYLPSQTQLVQMYNNVQRKGYGNFHTDYWAYYWSSTQWGQWGGGDNMANALRFSDGTLNQYTKNSVLTVRAARSFSYYANISLSGKAHPDRIYPIPNNPAGEIIEGVNLFTGQLDHSIPLLELQGVKLSYALNLLYNSATAQLVNENAANFYYNPVGGYGWKLMDYPKIAQDTNGYYFLDGRSVYPLQPLGNNVYTPGGKYYLWRVISKANNHWEIAQENGTHFKFNTNPVAINNSKAKLWNFSSMNQPMWQDSIQFTYAKSGVLTQMYNTIGDTVVLTYDTLSGDTNRFLKQIAHHRNGNMVDLIRPGYSSLLSPNGNSYKLLSELSYRHQVSASALGLSQAATKFNYLHTGGIAPLGGDNYPCALKSITTSSGAIYNYVYKSTSSSGIAGYKVVEYTVNDGYKNYSGDTLDAHTYHALTYDSSNVMMDKDHIYRRYNHVSLAPGGRFNAQKPHALIPLGNIEFYFINGQPSASLENLPAGYKDSIVTNPVLTGQPYLKVVNSTDSTNSLRKNVSLINYWNVGRLNSNGNGVFPMLTKTYNEMYHVGEWTNYQYGTEFQLPVVKTSTRRNPRPSSPDFNKDSLVTKYTYAFQTYPSLKSKELYCINAVSRTMDMVQKDMKGSFKVTDCICTQWSQWDSKGLPSQTSGYWAPMRWVRMRSWGADTSKCFTVSATDSSWLVSGQVNKRGAFGAVIDSMDESNINTTCIISPGKYGSNTIATFKNAYAYADTKSTKGLRGTYIYKGILPVPDLQNSNADFMGFEEYEPAFNNRWTASSYTINTDYAHTGKQSFSGNLSRVFTSPDNTNRSYKLGLWTGISALADSCSIAFADSTGKIIAYKSASIKQAGRTLKYIEISAAIKNGQTISLLVNTYGAAFADDITFMPLDAGFNANVYDLSQNIQIAQLGVNGQTTHLVYDHFSELIAQVGPGSIQNINNLHIPYSSRIGNYFVNGKDSFDTRYPNMKLDVSAKSDGNWQGFEYKSNNSFPPANLQNMSIEKKWLIATSTNASATFSHNVGGEHYAFYVEAFPNNLTSAQEMGFSLQFDSISGTNDSIVKTKELKFVLTGNALKLYSGSTVYESIPVSNVLNTTSLTFEIVGFNYVFCYANGRYLFEHNFDWAMIGGSVKLITNNTGAAFDNFIFVGSPVITAETYDALNRSKQKLTRTDMDELSVSEILYGGPLNLPLAQTRSAIIGGSGADLSLSYKPKFASGFNSDSMVVSDSSTLGGAANYSNPFSKSVQYSNSPLLEIVGLGGGGQFTAGEKGQHYSTFSYGDAAGNIFNYTNTEMLVAKKTEPNGVDVYTYYNREKTKFGEARIDKNDTIKTQYEYDSKGRLVRIYDPNFYNQQLAGHQNFTRRFGYDFTGNKIMMRTPDEGSSYYVYDPSGNLRFSIDSAGRAASPDQIVYRKYDSMGRLYEEGVLNINWNKDSLQYYADNRKNYPSGNWPGKSNYNWRKTYSYDGDGKNYNQGKLVTASTNWDSDLSAEVTETFAYDEYGNITQKGLRTSDFDTITRYINYQYNLQNRVVQIDYPGTKQPSTVYTYNGNGQVIGVGVPGNGNEFYYAEYDYGYQTIEYLNNKSFARTYNYNNAGWPTEINDPFFNETLSYEHKKTKDTTYDYNGKIAQLSNTLKWNNLPINASFTYDKNARLVSANYGPANPWSIGLTDYIRYDEDGNIQNLQLGTNKPYRFLYNQGTNQMQTLQGFQPNYVYTYNGNGSVTSVPYGVTGIQYDPVTWLTTSAAYNGNTVSYQYNGQNQRVLKKVLNTYNHQYQQMYLHGLNDYPLMELYKDTAGNVTSVFYIYGPKGLITMQQGQQRLFVLKDHLSSTRVIIDTANNVKAYFNYSTLGNIMESSIDSTIAGFHINYLFTGQEIENELGGMYNYQARLYDPGTGRFYSPDPLMQYASPYEYAKNNPINYIDPTGDWGFWSTIATIAVSVAVTAAVIVTAPVAASVALVAITAVVAGTAAGAVTGAVAGAINGDGVGNGFIYGAGIGIIASGLTAGAMLGGGAMLGTRVIGSAGMNFGRAGFTKILAGSSGTILTGTMAKMLNEDLPKVSSNIPGITLPTNPKRSRIITRPPSNPTPSTIVTPPPTQYNPTPLDAKDDGIGKPIAINASDFNKSSGKYHGYYSYIDLEKAKVIVPDNNFIGNSDCPKPAKSDKYQFPVRVIFKEDQTQKLQDCSGCTALAQQTKNTNWKDQYPDAKLIINANFFDVVHDLYNACFTNILGVTMSNSILVSTWKGSGNMKNEYSLDALIFYKDAIGKDNMATSKLQQNFTDKLFSDSTANAVGGIYFLRNGNYTSTNYKDANVKFDHHEGRTAIGISNDGKKLLILQLDKIKVNNKRSYTTGVTFQNMVTFFQKKGYTNAINFDGSGSSAFYYTKNGTTIRSCPSDFRETGNGNMHRPTPSIIGFKGKQDK